MSFISVVPSLGPGITIIGTVYVGCFLVHLCLPSRSVIGYACDWKTGKPLQYQLKGLATLTTMSFLWFSMSYLFSFDFDFLASNFLSSLFIANIVGLLGSSWLYKRGQLQVVRQPTDRCPTRDKPGKPIVTKDDLDKEKNRNFLAHFFLGQEFNPRFFGDIFDLKMFLYVVGAVMLALNVLSAVSLQYAQDGNLSLASLVYAFLFSHFLLEYLYFEEIHLYTYDLFAEKVGFKLFWGCTVFYPFFYCIGTYGIIHHTPGKDLSTFEILLTCSCFYFGWILTRGSNLQKFAFKKDPTAKTCLGGLITQETIPGSRILCSGFWGLSRHINYVGEIMQAIALSLPAYFVGDGWTSAMGWLYPVYYILLFIPRQIDDDAICAKKYGSHWKQYTERVPYRILPYVW